MHNFGPIHFKGISLIKSNAVSSRKIEDDFNFLVNFFSNFLISFFVARYLTVSLRGPVLTLRRGAERRVVLGHEL